MDMLVSAMKEGVRKYLGIDSEDTGSISFNAIAADGSTRRFFRVVKETESICLTVFPGDNSEAAHLEANAVHKIGCHLYERGAAVPKIHGFDSASGMVMMEDLGDQRLYDHLQIEENDDLSAYQNVVDKLVYMQFEGAVGFDVKWCWDTQEYDRGLMIERESRYFERACLNDLIGMVSPEGLDREFELIAENAGSGGMRCFLHRDFQSRNIMLRGEQITFIDFQGGRIGPPGYDLASLLNDPYADLTQETKTALYKYYVQQLGRYLTGDCREFEKTYPYLALQRNLQIAGAFSFLYKVRKKTFFKQYIIPALLNLQTLLMYTELQQFTILRRTVDQSLERIKQILGEN